MKVDVAEITKLFIEIFGYASFIILPIVLSAAIYFVLKAMGIGKADYFLTKKRSIYRVQRPLFYWALFFMLAIFNVFAVYELACFPIYSAIVSSIVSFAVLIISSLMLKTKNSLIPIFTCVVGDFLFLIVFNLTKDNDMQSNTNSVQDMLNSVQDKLTQNIQVFVFWVVILAAVATYIYCFVNEHLKKYTERVIIRDMKEDKDYYVVGKIDDEYLLACDGDCDEFLQKRNDKNFYENKDIEPKLFKIDDIRDNISGYTSNNKTADTCDKKLSMIYKYELTPYGKKREKRNKESKIGKNKRKRNTDTPAKP